MTQVDEVLKHAVLAVNDLECSSLIVLMVCNGEPEMHLAVLSTDLHKLNSSVDLAKLEMLRMITYGSENKKDRR